MRTLIDLTENLPDLEKQLKHELIWSGIKARLYFVVLALILIIAALGLKHIFFA